MPDRSRQKERKRLKRKRKNEAHRRAASVSPFKALSRVPSEVQCWMNLNWEITRQASIFVLRQTRSGRCAMAGFLVDFGVPGLKDAWGRIDISAAEFQENILGPMREQFPVGSVDVSEAARLVAGGLRFAHDNGFRLPHRYERWISILGDIGDWHEADVSDFDMEFAGSMDDLRRRLVGQSVEEFLARKDLSFVFSDDAPSLLTDDVLDFEEAEDKLREGAMEAVENWLASKQETPSPLLERAWDIYSEAVGESLQKVESAGDDSLIKVAGNISETISDLMHLEPPEDRDQLEVAIEQIARFGVENKEAMERLISPDEE
jgi:hypothetical protein